MPFYIRKSVSVGPFRFNLSKSGIGLSAGVKGFEMEPGPAVTMSTWGAMVSITGRHLTARVARPSPRIAPSPPSSEALAEVETGQVLEMADTDAKEFLGEINGALASFPVWPFLLFPGLVASIYLDANLFSERGIPRSLDCHHISDRALP